MAEIVVGVDGSERSIAALEFAVVEAERSGVAVRAVTAWDYPLVAGLPGVVFPARPFRRQAAEALEDLLEVVRAVEEGHPDADIEADLREGDAALVLLAAADGADLLVVGAHHGRIGGRRVGGVTQEVLAKARCPVVIV